MTDLLAIVNATSTDEELVDEIIRRHPDRVTLLVECDGIELSAEDSPRGRLLRDRTARLLSLIEARTSSVVVGLAWSRDQLLGWRFDRTIGGRPQPAPAF